MTSVTSAGAEAGGAERAVQLRRLHIHVVDVGELGVVLIAEPVVDEDEPAVAFEQQAPHGERNPVATVRRRCGAPTAASG